MFQYDTLKYESKIKKLTVQEAKRVLSPKHVPRSAFTSMLVRQNFREDVSASPFILADFLQRKVGDVMAISVNRLKLEFDHGNNLENLAHFTV